jgi:hypothetical protein
MKLSSAESQADSDFERLKKPIHDIIKLTDSLDERYREKCFELLLNFYLNRESEPKILTTTPSIQPKQVVSSKEVMLPIDLRAFLQQNGIPEEKALKLFLVDGEEIRPTYKITTTKKSTAQIQIALLASLENAMRKQGNKFEFSKEDIRARCQKHSVYDQKNFINHFKNNSKLFRNLDDADEIELSPEGQTELAEAITLVAQ